MQFPNQLAEKKLKYITYINFLQPITENSLSKVFYFYSSNIFLNGVKKYHYKKHKRIF